MRDMPTVQGSISGEDIDNICVHEHLLIDMTHEAVVPKSKEAMEIFNGLVDKQNAYMLRKNPYIVYENLILEEVEDALSELRYAQSEGVGILVDVTSVGLGRNINKLKLIANRTDISIAVGCGLFVHDSLPKEYADWSSVRIYDWMMDEIEHGIDETGIKPGIIGEIGTSEIIYPIEEKSLIASAKAQKNSGLPVMLHTYPWSEAAFDATQIMLAEGAKPEKICVCHVDVSFNYELIKKLLGLGVYIEFDDFGKELEFEAQEGAFAGGTFEKDIDRVFMLKKLCSEGYSKKILLANDICTKSMLHKFGGTGYDHIFKNIIPLMADQGITEADINSLIKVNPQLFLFE